MFALQTVHWKVSMIKVVMGICPRLVVMDWFTGETIRGQLTVIKGQLTVVRGKV